MTPCSPMAADAAMPAFQVDRLVRLAGVTLGPDEPTPDTLTFHLQTGAGDEVRFDLPMLLSALTVAVAQGAVPALPTLWYNQVWSIQGMRPPSCRDGMAPSLTSQSDAAVASACETDVTALMLFTYEGRDFWVSPGTLVQCLQIAAHESRVPPLDPAWVERAIPPAWRTAPRQPGDLLTERPDRREAGEA